MYSKLLDIVNIMISCTILYTEQSGTNGILISHVVMKIEASSSYMGVTVNNSI